MKDFKISIPLNIDLPGRDNSSYWPEMCRRLAAQKCDRVFLSVTGENGAYTPLEKTRALLPKFREARAIFQKAEIEPAIWLGHTIGHGSLFTGDERTFSCIWDCDANGENLTEQSGVFCPLDPDFVDYIAQTCAILAESGLSMMMFDDDFRLALHGQKFGCFCPLHMEAFRKRTGMGITAAELAKKITTDREVRRLWMENNAESLYSLAKAIEEAVHAVNPDMRLGLCSSPQLCNADGANLDKLAAIFAGKTRPFFRVNAAPYWNRRPEHAGEIIELSRMQKSWHKLPDIEIFAEGDTFPHNTYVTSANMLRAFTEGLAASGFSGILSYQYSYGDHRTTDYAYEESSLRNLDFLSAVSRVSPAQWQEIGFASAFDPQRCFMTQEIKPQPDNWAQKPENHFCKIAPRLAVPTTYDNNTQPVTIFGYAADYFTDGELRDFLKRGAIIDAPAAEKLMKRGFDLGIESMKARKNPYTADITDTGIPFLLRTFNYWVFHECKYREDAIVRLCSTFENGDHGIAHLKTGEGYRIVVMPWDVAIAAWTNFNHFRQQQWCEAYRFLAGTELPLTVNGKADVRLHIRISPDGNEVAASVQNLSLDKMSLKTLCPSANWQITAWLPPETAAVEPTNEALLHRQTLDQMCMCIILLKRK